MGGGRCRGVRPFSARAAAGRSPVPGLERVDVVEGENNRLAPAPCSLRPPAVPARGARSPPRAALTRRGPGRRGGSSRSRRGGRAEAPEVPEDARGAPRPAAAVGRPDSLVGGAGVEASRPTAAPALGPRRRRGPRLARARRGARAGRGGHGGGGVGGSRSEEGAARRRSRRWIWSRRPGPRADHSLAGGAAALAGAHASYGSRRRSRREAARAR